MGKPAARVGDMHVCPMFDGPKPHIGGPIIPPGAITTMVGGMPSACLSDMCTCAGPPDMIVLGSLGVLIGSKPAARMGDLCAHGGSIVTGLLTVLIGDSSAAQIAAFFAAFGGSVLNNPALIALIIQSPTLTNNLIALINNHWTIMAGIPGKGTFADRPNTTITIDPGGLTNLPGLVQSIAHESGHARYPLEPQIPTDGLSYSEWRDQNTQRNLRDEGEATLTNGQVRDEIRANGGPDIGYAGTQGSNYDTIYRNYQTTGDRQAARDQIGNVFGHGENPSNSTGQDYYDYYSNQYTLPKYVTEEFF